MLTCRALTSEAEIENLAEPWRALQTLIGLAPFTGFDWVKAWWHSLGQSEGAKPLVITCWEEGSLVGLLPFAITRKYATRVARFAGHEAFYMRNLLAKDESVTAALWAALRANDAYDFANIKNIHEGTADLTQLQTFATCMNQEPIYYRAHAGEPPEAAFAPYTKRFRSKLRKIAEEIHAKPELSFGVASDNAFLDEALPFLIDRKRAWCKKNGKHGLFDSPRVEAFYRAMCDVAAQEKLLQVFWLRKKEALISVLLCFVFKGTLYAHTVAHDPSARPLKPGLFLKAEAVRWACANDLQETNFMEGQEYFKRRFASAARLASEFGYARTLKGKLFFFAFRTRQKLRRLTHVSEET